MILLNRAKFLYKTDWLIVLTIIFLSILGLAAIYSVALGRGLNEFGNFEKQLLWLLLGIPIMLLVSLFDYRLLLKIGWVGYFIFILLLILVITPLGSEVKGASTSFNFGFMNFQPIEMFKIFLIIVLADICSRYSRTVNKLPQLICMGVIVAFPIGLALLQPDLGSGSSLFFIWLVAFLLIVKKKWHLALIFGLIIVVIIVGWFFMLQDYQKERILTFVDPARDPRGSGYNVRQSIIAVGAGKLMGRGLGFGSQSQLKFIPESHTDFIFSVIAEEIGFIGVIMLLSFFGIFFFRFYKIAIRAPDDFGMFIAILSTALIFFHVIINIGMCLGVMPVTGISLPFVSYGGSFLITSMILVGINLSIYRYSNIKNT
jgi:rod shape determining protein RodA